MYADPPLRDEPKVFTRTALMNAARNGNLQLLEWFIDNSIVAPTRKDILPALNAALELGHIHVVRRIGVLMET